MFRVTVGDVPQAQVMLSAVVGGQTWAHPRCSQVLHCHTMSTRLRSSFTARLVQTPAEPQPRQGDLMGNTDLSPNFCSK